MSSDWSFLRFTLARMGIPSDVDEVATDSYAWDPWRPAPESEAVRIILDKADATRLNGLLGGLMEKTVEEQIREPR